jgi:hypothetical protein
MRRLAEASESRYSGTALIDATFANPNYWLRFSLLRAAMGLAHGREVGLLGRYAVGRQCRTLRRLGITETVSLSADSAPTPDHLAMARELVDKLTGPDDLLTWKLPYGIPAWDLYDCLLKQQRRAFLDVADERLAHRVAVYLDDLDKADSLIESIAPDFAVLSHTASAMTNYGTLAWHLARRGIPFVVPFGSFGNLQHYKVNQFESVFQFANRPHPADIAALDESRAAALEQVGGQYLSDRVAGRTEDLSAHLAYAKGSENLTRQVLNERFGWDTAKPVVAVFASVWYDNPHVYGMTTFRDFHDWLNTTLNTAVEVTDVNWLLKPHPSEDWYGGVKLRDMLPIDLPAHIRFTDDSWSAATIPAVIDGLITCHGTAGIEMAAAGIPVMVAAEGWYHDLGFAVWAGSRQGYIDALRRRWWKEWDAASAPRLARIFAGFYFCQPADREMLRLDEDVDQTRLYPGIAAMLMGQRELVDKEVANLGNWMASSSRHLHMFNMWNATRYTVPGSVTGQSGGRQETIAVCATRMKRNS